MPPDPLWCRAKAKTFNVAVMVGPSVFAVSCSLFVRQLPSSRLHTSSCPTPDSPALAPQGKNGTGKSTLLKALFNGKRREAEAYPERYDIHSDSPDQHDGDTTTDIMREVGKLSMTFHDDSSSAAITSQDITYRFIDTRGFGDKIDNTDTVDELVKVVEDRFEGYERMLSKTIDPADRIRQDERIHMVLLFCQAGRADEPIMIEVQRRLHKLVNIIPVVGKADSMTTKEREKTLLQMLRVQKKNYEEMHPSSVGDAAARGERSIDEMGTRKESTITSPMSEPAWS